MTDDSSKDLKAGQGGDLAMTAVTQEKRMCMQMRGRSGTWMANQEEAWGSGIAQFGRGSGRGNPCFSESKSVDVASFNDIRDSCIFERVEK